MKKKNIDILAFIPNRPLEISPGELILKLKVGTNRELRQFNKEIQHLIFTKVLVRNKNGALSRNVASANNKPKQFYQNNKLTRASTKQRHHFKQNKDTPVFTDAKEDFIRICQEFKFPTQFTAALQKEIQEIIIYIQTQNEMPIRKNYREDLVITIDGEDAKDLDDAISVQKQGEHFFLNVHIADVSHFVNENTLVDKEAQKRGNSVYLINKVVPMLPEILSNDYCSLNPKQDKLTLSCEMVLSSTGEVLSNTFQLGIIKTAYRLSYSLVEDIITQKQAHTDKRLVQMLQNAEELAVILKKKRLKEGALDFFLPETHIICDSKDNPIRFEVKKTLFSQSIIEEFMLAANQSAAKLLWKNKTGIFRVHEAPSQEKLSEFYKTAKMIGIKVKPFRNSQDIQNFLAEPRNPYLNTLLHQILVRSMSQAQYTPKNIGHFGLGFSLYTHFTSPIRRYADLVVHRQIKQILKFAKNSLALQPKYLSQVSQHISKTERIAIDAERKIEKLKAIRFLSKYPKELELSAHVTGVHSRGIFVSLDHTHIEGLIPSIFLQSYDYVEESYCYKKQHSPIKITIGSPVVVKVSQLNIQKGFIDFQFVKLLEH